MDLLEGEQPEILAQSDPPPVDLSVGDIRSQIEAESWLQIAQRSQWRAYRKLRSLFLMVPSLTPTTSPSPKWGPMCPMIREWPYLRNEWSDTLHVLFWGRVFRVGGSNGTISVISNPSWRQAAMLEIFEWPYLRKGSCYPLHVKILW